jgi:hypothetical protein
MPKSRASRGILLTSNLPQLQNLIKRDPISYREEFLTQYNHYLSLLRLLQHSPLAFSNDSGTAGDGTIKSSSNSSTSNGQHFRELVTFISQVAQCYPAETKTFPKELGDLLMEDGKIGGSGGARGIGNDTRKSIVQNLVMLRNKGVTTSQQYVIAVPERACTLADSACADFWRFFSHYYRLQPLPLCDRSSKNKFLPISRRQTRRPKITSSTVLCKPFFSIWSIEVWTRTSSVTRVVTL